MPQPNPTDQAPRAVAAPIARVAVDTPLAHLDRPFDYAVPAEQDAAAVPGARVRVRFAGKLRDGFVLDRPGGTEHVGALAPLARVVSSEPVLTPEVARLVRRVADHYAGSFADVVRLAVPPRHAATEQAAAIAVHPALVEPPARDGPFAAYPGGPALLEALRAGRSPRAAWQVTPTAGPEGDWAAGLAYAARASLQSGRAAVLVVPDQRDVDRLRAACARIIGAQHVAVLVAEAGPAARYRAFLAALRGQARVVIGNRAAAFAPTPDLGLVAVFDDGDDLLAEPRGPYPHARTVLALRAAETGAAAIFAGYARTADVQRWVRTGWLRELAQERPAVRHAAPRVRVAADSDLAMQRDPAARAARLPHDVFEVLRGALAQGPVLVQVPRAGYLVSLVCQDCREPARCADCSGPVRARPALTCGWCGRSQAGRRCPLCGSGRLRAPVVGADRTAEELGRAFPHTPVRQSAAGRVLAEVPPEPAIVVATPGAEPRVDGGYPAAVLLDTGLLLLRADLRAEEEAVRRWLNAVALVRGGAAGGTVIAVGEASGRALQALVRVDPAGFAERELADREAAGFPPAVALATAEGGREALAELVELAELPAAAELLGPVELPGSGAEGGASFRLTLRAPLGARADLAVALKQAAALRSARKLEGAVRVRVDPAEVG